jgi:hypothetical protein
VNEKSKCRLCSWRLILLLFVGLLLILAVSLSWWYFDDGDLRAVKERARTLGVPTTWDETGREMTKSDRLSIWKGITDISDHPSMFSYRNEKSPNTQRKTFAPITPELLAHHQAFDSEKLVRLLRLIDQLGSEALIFHRSLTLRDGPCLEIAQYQRLVFLLNERVLLAPSTDVPLACRRSLGLIFTFETPTLTHLFVRNRLFTSALNSIAERITDVKEIDPGFAKELARLAEQITFDSDKARIGEFLSLLDLVENPPSYSECKSLGTIADGSWDGQPTPWMFRFGRRHLLDTQLNWLVFLRQKPNMKSALVYGHELENAPNITWDARNRLDRFFLPPLTDDVVIERTCQLHAHLLIAELKDESWPIDNFDLLHHQLRRIERDGKLMGAYSVYEDGVDDGGAKGKDRYFPLYGPLEAPVMLPKP